MTSQNKILTIFLGFLSTLLVFTEAGQHGNSNELATLLAAGLITLMLRDGATSRNTLSLARHAHGLILPEAHGLSLESFPFARNAGFGFDGFQAFNFAPMFGGLRYNLANLNHIPLPGPNLNKGTDFNMPFGRSFGLYPPLPDMLRNNRQNEINDHFDIVRNIIQRERQNTAPHQNEQQQEPPFNPQNREFFNFDRENKPPAERRTQRIN